MRIYLISLEQDTQRRNELAQRFPLTYPKMQWVQAVNGKELTAKEYFSYAQQYFNTHKKIITPSEVGCTLSHIKALETFLETDDEYCLILEDDVIGDDKDLNFIIGLVYKNGINGVLALRSQKGFGYEKYIMAKHHNDFYRLPSFSVRFIYGTCAYIVNRYSARIILESHRINFEIADIWSNIINKNIDFYYLDLFIHPEDLTTSHIESERAIFYTKEKNFFKRIYKQGLFWKIYNRLRNDIYRWILILKGYKQIHKDKP